MALTPYVDFDPDPIDLDDFGLDILDRAKLSKLVTSEGGTKAAKSFLESKFGTTFEAAGRELENQKRSAKRHEAAVEAMTKSFERFCLHFPRFLNTERNQKTLLAWLPENGYIDFTYQVLVQFWNELADVDGALDLDETTAPRSPYYVGQITPGAEFEKEYAPKKRISEMSADEFTRAIIRSPKFRLKLTANNFGLRLRARGSVEQRHYALIYGVFTIGALSLVVLGVEPLLFPGEEPRNFHRRLQELHRVFLGPSVTAQMPPRCFVIHLSILSEPFFLRYMMARWGRGSQIQKPECTIPETVFSASY